MWRRVLRDLIRQKVTLRQELEMLNRLLNPKGTRPNGKKKQISKKQRTKLVGRRDRARERLQELNQQPLTHEVECASDPLTCSTESTHERQLPAERLRRRLDLAGTISCSFSTGRAFVKHLRHFVECKEWFTAFNQGGISSWPKCHQRRSFLVLIRVEGTPSLFQLQRKQRQDVPSRLLRIVTISDTHGYEHELFAHTTQGETPYLLPSADVLLHCGDFSKSGSRKVKMQAKARLDAFLAAQTHISTKIVIRGNHDPHTSARVLFPRSKAMYVTRPTTMTLQHNITLELRPFSRRGTIPLLPSCDILASHEPPVGILDLTYQRTSAGSTTLRQAVESSKDKPSLWLCGHIHEGRGSVLHTFVDKHTEAI